MRCPWDGAEPYKQPADGRVSSYTRALGFRYSMRQLQNLLPRNISLTITLYCHHQANWIALCNALCVIHDSMCLYPCSRGKEGHTRLFPCPCLLISPSIHLVLTLLLFPSSADGRKRADGCYDVPLPLLIPIRCHQSAFQFVLKPLSFLCHTGASEHPSYVLRFVLFHHRKNRHLLLTARGAGKVRNEYTYLL